jgi:hypothetical protein
MAAPIPRELPVTRATLPSNSPMRHLTHRARRGSDQQSPAEQHDHMADDVGHRPRADADERQLEQILE